MNYNTVCYFEIESSNPAREVHFYHSIFGWIIKKDEDHYMEYYRIETGGIQGGLLKRPDRVPPTGMGINAFVCSIQVENFDATQDKILALGGTISLAKFAVPGRCWLGYFIDPDNNVFGVFEIDEKAK